MRRAVYRRTATGMSLFPFLAVLICTMGALIVLLVMVLQQARVQASSSPASTPAQTAEQATEERKLRESKEDLDWRREMLMKQREDQATELSNTRKELSHLEDHIRRLQEQAKQIDNQVDELNKLGESGSQDQAGLKAEFAKLQFQIEMAKRQLDVEKKKAESKPRSFAIIPYQGPNGTKRRPIYIECAEEGITIYPEKILFQEVDFQGPLGPGNPLDAALRTIREYMVKNDSAKKDGEPYPLLLVRPNGTRAYSAARSAMKTWDDEFGYELIDAKMELKFPPPDPVLEELLMRTLRDALSRQAVLAAAMPTRFKNEESQGFVASSRGGFSAAPGSDTEGTSLQSGRGNGGRGPGGSGGNGFGPGGSGFGTAPNGFGSAPNGFGTAPNGFGANGTGGKFGSNQLAQGNGFGGQGPGGQGFNGQGGNGQGPGGTGYGGTGNGGTGSGGTGTNGTGPGGSGAGGTGPGGQGGASGQGASSSQGSGGQGGSNSQGSQGGGGGNGSASVDPIQSAGGGSGTGATAGQNAQQGGPSSSFTYNGQRNQNGQSGSSSGTSSNSANGSNGDASSGSSNPSSSSGGGSSSSATESLARHKGHDWALKNKTSYSTGITRPIRVQCFTDRLVILSERGDTQRPYVVKLKDGYVRGGAEEFVAGIWKHMEPWGLAVAGGYWKPVLRVEVGPGADPQYAQLEAVLRDSGLDVQRK